MTNLSPQNQQRVEEFEHEIRMAMIAAKSNPQAPKAEHYASVVEHLTTLLKETEREKEEAVREERERILEIVREYAQPEEPVGGVLFWRRKMEMLEMWRKELLRALTPSPDSSNPTE